jgi:pyruvate formate lyase activating enzyme
MYKTIEKRGSIFDVQRWSLQDGKGIRTTIFLNDCPLRCKWCHNPESWNSRPVLTFENENCYSCGNCIEVCKAGANTLQDGKIKLQKHVCTLCGECVDVCSENVREIIGEEMSIDQLIKVIERDMVFYRESGGGVTFSGGEPTSQEEFLREVVKKCKELGIDTAIETCGYFQWDKLKDIFEMLDFVYIDLKHMDNDIHKQLTGVGNKLILENAINISNLNKKIIIRIPLIEDVNDDLKNIKEALEFISENLNVNGIELLNYHDYGVQKYKALGMENNNIFKSPQDEKVEEIKNLITKFGLVNVK